MALHNTEHGQRWSRHERDVHVRMAQVLARAAARR